MFECGLEGITLKVVKKSQFEHIECEVSTDSGLSDIIKSHENLENSEMARSAHATPKMTDSRPQTKSGSNQTPKLNERDKKTSADEENSKQDPENVSREQAVLAKDSGNVSSCIIEFKVVWFNFAAPPRAPITRKIDYTR